MNAKIYKKECIPRLVKFIDTLGNRSDVLFWPDMATCHYEKCVKEELEKQNIDYVKKKENLWHLEHKTVARFTGTCHNTRPFPANG